MFRTAVVALGLGYALQHPAMEAAHARRGVRFEDEDFVDHACRLLLGDDGAPARRPRRRGARRGAERRAAE